MYHINYRVYGTFTMETILATAFGCAVNVQGGESNELTEAANIIFQSQNEGSATNFYLITVLSSKFDQLSPIANLAGWLGWEGDAIYG